MVTILTDEYSNISAGKQFSICIRKGENSLGAQGKLIDNTRILLLSLKDAIILFDEEKSGAAQ